MNQRILLFIVTLVLVPLLTYFAILFARGFRPTPGGGPLMPTGILAATSLPRGAQLYIDGQFRSATDANINLPPGSYEIEMRMDTYHTWKKTLDILPEEVTRASAILFPTVPVLKSITTAGAAVPALSPDGTKVAFIQAANRASNLYVLDLSDSPLGILNRDPRLLSSLPVSQVSNLIWSPDSKQLLLSATASAYLADISSAQTPTPIVNPAETLTRWGKIVMERETQKHLALPTIMQDIMASAAADLVWSPNEKKLMYTATASATIPDRLIRPLPGSSTQPQKRDLTPGNVYIYDLEEDRNFEIGENAQGLSWFPTSNHLIRVEPGKVTVFEYDGGNPTVVYEGPLEESYAFPYPSSRQLLILARINAQNPQANLYAVGLR